MDRSTVFVSYQMGKVASSSITNALEGCLQIHSWSAEEPIKYFSSRYTGSLSGRVLQNLKWKFTFLKLQRLIFKAEKQNGTIKLIVGVREPVSRNISGYFQTLTHRERGVTVDSCIDSFYAHCPHFLPLMWFDIELKKNLGIDVYNYPFDKDKGYVRIKEGDFDIFIYQMERLANLQPELSEYLGVPSFEINRVNDAADKWLGALYRSFTEEFKPSESYMEMLYESKYVKHFYSERDVAGFIRKWSKKD